MIDAVAVVPHPPLVVEELAGPGTGSSDDPVAALRAAVRAAGTRLGDAARSWVAVGADRRTGRWGPAARGTFAGFGADVVVALGPDGSPRAADAPEPDGHGTDGEPDPDLPLPLLVAGWLRGAVAPDATVDGVVLPAGCPADRARACGEEIAAAASGPTALLVLGDAAATHSAVAPGGFDPRAAGHDAALAAALAGADLDALADRDPALASALGVGGRPGWQVLAAAARGTTWRAELLHDAHPFGVGYLVAVWERA